MEVARAASAPMRSSMRRSTPGIGEGIQSSRAECTAARAPKSALRFISKVYRHPRESGGPGAQPLTLPPWVPAFAGMTKLGRKALVRGDSFRGGELDRVEVLRLGRDLAELDLFDLFDELHVGWGGATDFLAFGGDQPVDEIDLGATALQHVLTHRWPRQLGAGVRLQRGEDRRFDFVERGPVPFGRAGDRFRLVHADVLELIAERLADAHPLAGEADAETADLLVPVRIVAGQPAGCRDAVGHALVAHALPALAPEIRCRLDAVDRADHVRELLDSLGYAPVQLADAVDLVWRGPLRAGAANPPRAIELGAEQRGDDPDGLVRDDDPGATL